MGNITHPDWVILLMRQSARSHRIWSSGALRNQEPVEREKAILFHPNTQEENKMKKLTTTLIVSASLISAIGIGMAPNPNNVNWGRPQANVNWGAPTPNNVNWGRSANVNWGAPSPNNVNWGRAQANVNWGAPTPNN